MSPVSFSPGPWRYERAGKREFHVLSLDNTIVARVTWAEDEEDDEPLMEANAQAIAAFPGLLDAAQLVIDVVGGFGITARTTAQSMPFGFVHALLAAVDECKAALRVLWPAAYMKG